MSLQILVGDALATLRTLPAKHYHCVVTSPPYWWLRDYGVAGQLGREATPEEYVARMVEVFAEVRRVLRSDGTLWLNIGDSWAGHGIAGHQNLDKRGQRNGRGGGHKQSAILSGRAPTPPGLPPKSLLLMPARVALGLQAAGWVLRSEIIWAKANPMPESVTDRPTRAHEQVYLLSPSTRYFYDSAAVAEPAAIEGAVPTTRNLRSVWTLATHPYREAHFATFPPALVERCLLAGTSARGCCSSCGAPWTREVVRRFVPQQDVSPERGRRGAPGQKPLDASNRNDGYPRGTTEVTTTGWRPSCACAAGTAPCRVLDPFGGAGTTALVARRLGRAATLIELSPTYAEMARRRIEGDAPLLNTLEVA